MADDNNSNNDVEAEDTRRGSVNPYAPEHLNQHHTSSEEAENFHEASDNHAHVQVNEAFFDSQGQIHSEETFSYFDALEVLYFEDMLSQQQPPLSERSIGSTSSASQEELDQLEGENLEKRIEPVEGSRGEGSNSSSSIGCNEEEAKKTIVSGIKGRVDANQKKLRKLARKQREKFERSVHARRRKLKRMISDPSFVMTMDKVSFVLGILTIMTMELVLLVAPSKMGFLYATLLVPLMVARYIIYRADLYHYFMYDFCYFSQVLMLIHLFKIPDNIKFTKALFSVSNGPLAMAVVMWKNSLVFHSMDKMTSMFIHILPALVMFCQRWGDHISKRQFPLLEAMDGSLQSHAVEFWLNPFCYYVLWQTIYLVKTEVISKKKLTYNTEIMTSLRWMTRKRDSASYKLLSYFGEDNQLPTFVVIQAVYTLVTFLIMPLLWHSVWLHSLYLLVVFIVALVNGASYYFHVFAVRYIEEVGKRVSEENRQNNESLTN